MMAAPRLPPGIPCVTDCVMAELEKLGHRYRVALRYVSPSLPWSSPCMRALEQCSDVYDVHAITESREIRGSSG